MGKVQAEQMIQAPCDGWINTSLLSPVCLQLKVSYITVLSFIHEIAGAREEEGGILMKHPYNDLYFICY